MTAPAHDYLHHAGRLAERGIPFVTVTLVQPEGHVPQDIGAKAVVTAEGLAWGTVGGGRLEARAIDHAKSMLARAVDEAGVPRPVAPELVRYELARDLNMVCGGAASLFYEVATAATWNIVVFGAGHVAQATVALLSTFHCNLTCIDPRSEWLGRIEARQHLPRRHRLSGLDQYVTHGRGKLEAQAHLTNRLKCAGGTHRHNQIALSNCDRIFNHRCTPSHIARRTIP